MTPALETTTMVPAIVYATALLSDTQLETRSHNDELEASMTTGSDMTDKERAEAQGQEEVTKRARNGKERSNAHVGFDARSVDDNEMLEETRTWN